MKKIVVLICLILILFSCGKNKEIINNEKLLNQIEDKVQGINEEEIISENIIQEKKDDLDVEIVSEEENIPLKKSEFTDLIINSVIVWKWPYMWKVDIYNMDDLEKDIIAEKDENNWYTNSVQLFSKTENFDKNLSLTFFNNIKNGNFSQVKDLFIKNDLSDSINKIMLSPFYPACCSSKNYLTVSEYKDWIFWLYSSWNGGHGYSFYYITTYENNLIEFSFWTGFNTILTNKWEFFNYWANELFKVESYNDIEYMKKIFRWEEISEDYNLELEKVKNKITRLYK